MRFRIPLLLLALFGVSVSHRADGQKPDDARTMTVKTTEDFELQGDGSAEQWKKAEWEPLHFRGREADPLSTKFKILYSKKGIYVLMEAVDKKITSTMKEDFLNLWTEDVFEVFLQPDARDNLYFEYEISPLGYELPILIPNMDGKILGWRPWHYEGGRKVRKATSAVGGELKSGAEVKGWKAEVFIPYELLSPLRSVPPKPGSRWKANFYRMDYDGDKKGIAWDWSRVGGSFHEFQKFGTLVFE